MRQRPLLLLTFAVLAAHGLLLAWPGMQEALRKARITGSTPKELRFEVRQITPPPPAAVPPAPTPASRPSVAQAAPIAPRPQIQKAPPEQSPTSRASVGPKFREGLAEKPAASEAAPPVEAEAAPAAPSALDQLLASGEASPAPTPEPIPGSAADLQPLHAMAAQEDASAAPHAPAAEAKTEAEVASASEPAAPIGIGSPGYAGPMPAIKLPPSAQLQFQAKGSAKGFQYSAKAQLTFKTDGQRYQAEQEVSAFLMGSRSQTSSGQITPYGLAPERFVDKARKERSAALDTAGNRIRYSDGDEPQTISAGVQDRLSIFLQLSSMVSANPERYVEGSTVAINVTSARSMEVWTFVVDGPETLDLPAGPTPTLRLTRQPRKGQDQSAHLWLAPAMQYLPVRIRLSQSNGDFADLQLQAAKVEGR
ncbi:DUF3108 domain-containing protein [Comamonas piscis]|uniref:DUF3108 domain-containing protein n=1 Tax=Comamonas piscis TaxID=1562974 RepID=A0A7G5EDR5_9BURK|nr:DUF3108 domain-containing protein [Comamonas piscis]QMV72140.1 DUF3108 domain-containing protein [Comamonas piscis]WSO34890.1 DUF3108 domain-containing protein [Comamonas piscis]